MGNAAANEGSSSSVGGGDEEEHIVVEGKDADEEGDAEEEDAASGSTSSGSDSDSEDSDNSSDSDEEDDEEKDKEEAEDEEEVKDGEADSGSQQRRSGSSGQAGANGCILSVDHGEPVTKVLLLPGGSTLLTAGGNSLKLWDVLGRGRLIHTFAAHQKLITALCMDGTGTRVVSGGLDGLLKAYDIPSLSVTHTARCDAPLVSVAVSPDNTRLVLGATDGTITARQRVLRQAELVTERKSSRLLRGGTYRFFLRGVSTSNAASTAGGADITVATGRKQVLSRYDALLKAFHHRAALEAALSTNRPLVFQAVCEELAARGVLDNALGGRDAAGVEALVEHVSRHIGDPSYTEFYAELASRVLDIYAPLMGSSAALDRAFHRLQERLTREARLEKQLLGLQGALDMLMAVASNTGMGASSASAAAPASLGYLTGSAGAGMDFGASGAANVVRTAAPLTMDDFADMGAIGGFGFF
jgi:hypothetical protein